MEWAQLDPDAAREFIAKVERRAFKGLFNTDLSTVHARPLPFFEKTLHVSLENSAVAPALCMEYLMRGGDIEYLDGSDAALQRLCEAGALVLSPETVIDYLEFHCRVVMERPNNILLLKNVSAMRLFSDAYHYLDFHFDKNNYGEKDISFVHNADDNSYVVRAPFVFDGKIDPATAYISAQGHIRINRREGF